MRRTVFVLLCLCLIVLTGCICDFHRIRKPDQDEDTQFHLQLLADGELLEPLQASPDQDCSIRPYDLARR